MCGTEIQNPTAQGELHFIAPDCPVETCNGMFFRYLHTSSGLLGLGVVCGFRFVRLLCCLWVWMLNSNKRAGSVLQYWRIWPMDPRWVLSKCIISSGAGLCMWSMANMVHLFKKWTSSNTQSSIIFFREKDRLQRCKGKWDKMQHDLPSKINLQTLTDLADTGNPTVLLPQGVSESLDFVGWISSSTSHAGEVNWLPHKWVGN